MRLSKQHKVYGLVLGLAVTAFGADRFLFAATPAEASATAAEARPAPQRRAAQGVAAKPAATAAAVETVTDNQAVAERLSEVARSCRLQAGQVADAFTPSPAWVKPEVAVVAEVPATQAVVAKVVDVRAQRFAQEHRLTAVMNGIAVVDGAPLRPGHTLDDFTLTAVSVKERKATFERAGERVVLHLTATGASVAHAN